MSNYDRGYEPPQDDRLFDAADDEEEEEEGSRLPLLIVIALLVLAAFAGVVWLAYSQGVERGRSDAGPAVAQQDTGSPAAGDIVKPYEQPAPADEDAGAQAGSAPVSDDEGAVPTPEQQPSAAAPAPAAAAPAPAQTIASTPEPAASKPVATPPVQVATAKPEAAPAATQTPVAEATGGIALQIGAYKSQAEANSAWAAYKGKHAALVSSYSPNTVKVDLGTKGTWYRLRIGPFQSRADAVGLCEKLKADGASCFLAK